MLLSYGNTLCPPGWRIDENIPAGYCRVYYVRGGRVVYTDSQRHTELLPGHLYIFPSASPYRMRQDIANRLHCTFIHIDVSPALVSELVECAVTDNSLLKHILLALAAAIDLGDRKLVYALADVFELYALEQRFIVPPVHALSKTLSYIDSHIGEDITVSAISAMAGYNEQYFIRLFRKSIGLTPYQYIISQRLKAAKKMLASNDSITQVAEMTGYHDIKSFSRAFIKSFGMTPSAYRKNHTLLP